MVHVRLPVAVIIITATLLCAIALVIIYSNQSLEHSSYTATVTNSIPAPSVRIVAPDLPGAAVRPPAPLVDTTPPTVPSGLGVTVGPISNNMANVTLSWSPSVDDQNSVGYLVYVGKRVVGVGIVALTKQLIDVGSATSYVRQLGPGTYVFGVIAYDTSPAMNMSEMSSIVRSIATLTIVRPVNGSIISNDGNISCGILGQACSHQYNGNQVITLSAIPANGYFLQSPSAQNPNTG